MLLNLEEFANLRDGAELQSYQVETEKRFMDRREPGTFCFKQL